MVDVLLIVLFPSRAIVCVLLGQLGSLEIAERIVNQDSNKQATRNETEKKTTTISIIIIKERRVEMGVTDHPTNNASLNIRKISLIVGSELQWD